MTHKDIYTKFMIEYDKAGASTSYPSLTEYEVATVLDKAYNALIAQKVTGNNVRRATFESDIKSIADLGPLTKTTQKVSHIDMNIAPNAYKIDRVDEDLLYFLQATVTYSNDQGQTSSFTPFQQPYNPVDGQKERKLPVKLVNHEIAQKFFSSAYNMPWIKQPVCYVEDRSLIFLVDPLNKPKQGGGATLNADITYIRKPNTFVKELGEDEGTEGTCSYFNWDESIYPDTAPNAYQFECNSTVAEELVSLAVAFALENVESQRLNSKLNMRGLEA